MNYVKNERFFKLKKEDMVDSEGLNYITQFRGEYKNTKVKRRKKYNIRKKNKKDQIDIVTFSICAKDENLYLKLKKNDSNIKKYNIDDNDIKASFIDDIEYFISKPSANVQSIYQTVDEILNILKLSFKKDTIIRVTISTYSTDSYVLFFKQDESSDIQGESNFISLSEEDIVSLVCINKDHRIYYDMKTDYVIIKDFTYLYDICVGFGNRINKSTKTVKFGNYRMGHYKDDIIKLRYKCIPVLFKKAFSNIFSEQKYEKLKWDSHFPQYNESDLDDLTKHVIFYGGSTNKICTLTLKNGSTVELEGDGELTSSMIKPYKSTLVSAEIGKLCTSISSSAFSFCTGLKNITISDSVTSIGNYAFSRCDSLTSIVVNDDNTVYDSRNNCNAIIKTATNTLAHGCKTTIIPNSITSIGEHAFSGCIGLTSITIPDSVTSIGSSSFNGCSGLTSITIPDSVTSIGYNAFSSCTGLTSVAIGNGVTSIGFNAFYSCTDLTNVTIGNSVTSIGASAFYGCTGLKSITIPDSVTSIGDNAFYSCTGLTNITSLATTAPIIKNSTFRVIKTGGTLTVTSGSTGYNTWMSTGDYYLGKYSWKKVEQ